MVGGQHEVVGQREEDREQEAGQRQDHRGSQEPAASQTVRHAGGDNRRGTQLILQVEERLDHGDVSLDGEGDGEVDAGGHGGLGQGQADGHDVVPGAGSVLGPEVGHGEGEGRAQQVQRVRQRQHQQQPGHQQVKLATKFRSFADKKLSHFSDFHLGTFTADNLWKAVW